jgi:hypothetical protein
LEADPCGLRRCSSSTPCPGSSRAARWLGRPISEEPWREPPSRRRFVTEPTGRGGRAFLQAHRAKSRS